MTIKTLKNSITLFFLFLYTLTASAESINQQAPFSQTGSYQKIIRTVNEQLVIDGWNFDLKITGNPVLSKSKYQRAKDKIILVWGLDTNGSKSDPHYLAPVVDETFLGITHVAANYVCVTNKDLTIKDFLDNKKNYRVGTPTDALLVNWYDRFQKGNGTNHTAIKYRGSNKVGNALFSGEIDFAITSGGAKLHDAGKVNCILSTDIESILGIPTVKQALPNYDDPIFLEGIYWIAKNFSDQELIKLKSDYARALKSKPVVDHLKGRFSKTPNLTLDQQANMLKGWDAKLD